MDGQRLLAQVRDVMTVKQVYGEPIERDGLMIIPVTKIMGGGGGGSAGTDGATSGASGNESQVANPRGGFGLRAVPTGVYVIKDGSVTWQPAFDVNRVILGGQLVAVVLFLVIRAIVGVLARRQEA